MNFLARRAIVAKLAEYVSSRQDLLYPVLAAPFVLYFTWWLLLGTWKLIKPLVASVWPFRRQILTNLRFDEPLRPQTDKAVRDSVFKQDFDESKIPTDLDAIIIGSGISSLTTALLLSRAGKKVLVLEQYSSAGGCLGALDLHGHEFNIGMLVVLNSGLTKHITSKAIFDELTAGAVGWADLPSDLTSVERESLGDVKDTAEPPSPICTLGGSTVADWKEHLIKQFPDEKGAIDHFANTFERVWADFVKVSFVVKFLPVWLVKAIAKLGIIDWFTDWTRWCEEPLEHHLQHITGNQDLQRALCAVLPYILPSTRVIPMAVSGSMHHLFTAGASYPIGGSTEIVFHMIKQIHNLGGQVMVNATVTSSILVDKNGKHAIGVVAAQSKASSRVEGAEKPSVPSMEIHAPIVVSGTGVWNTYKKLMPSHLVDKYPLMKAALEKNTLPSASTWLSVFLTFNGTSEELNLDQRDHVILPADLDLHKPWFYEVEEFLSPGVSMDKDCRFSKEEPLKGFPQTFISFSSARDPFYNTKYPGKSCCTASIGVPWDWFSKWHDMNNEELDEDEEHTSLERKVGERLLTYIQRRFPQLKDKVDTVDYWSPVRLGSVLGSYSGKLLGMELNPQRFSLAAQTALRPRTGLKGFFLTGQDVFTPGTQLAALSGFWTASEVLDRSLILEMEIRERTTGWQQKKANKKD